MIKSIFFRALTLLGLTFVLIGCGAADPGEGTPGTPGTAGAAALSMDDVTKEVEKLIRDSKGKVDLADGQAVATKIVSIMKASQPMGSCSLFSQSIFPTFATDTGAVKPLVVQGSEYPGGLGKLTVSLSADLTAAGAMAANTIISYKYDKYSIDGIYFLDGTLKMKQAAATAAATVDVSDFTAEASELKLTMGGVDGAEAKEIAKIAFAAAFAAKFSAAAGLYCGVKPFFNTVQADAITISKEGDSKFEDVVLSITAVGSATLLATGKNVSLLQTLVGPRYS